MQSKQHYQELELITNSDNESLSRINFVTWFKKIWHFISENINNQ